MSDVVDRSAQEKRRQLQVMLDAGLVMLHLDPRGEAVIVPAHFKGDPVLRLNLAWGFNLPALDIGADSVYAVLSFNRQNFGCTLPWACIFAMTAPDAGHEGIVWPDSVPAELAPYFQAAGQSSSGVPVSLRAEERPRRTDPRRPAAPAQARAAHATHGAPRDPESTTTAGADEPPPAPRPLFVVHQGGRDDDAPAPAASPASEEATSPTASPSAPEGGQRPRPNLRLVKD